MAFEIIVAPVAVKSLRKLPAHIRAEVKNITLSSCVVLPRRVQQFMKVVESDSKMHRARSGDHVGAFRVFRAFPGVVSM